MLGAPVDRDEDVAGDRSIARLGMRERAVLGGGDDRGEARLFRTQLAHALLERDRHLMLCAARETAFQRRTERLVGERGGSGQQGDLARLLDGTQSLDDA